MALGVLRSHNPRYLVAFQFNISSYTNAAYYAISGAMVESLLSSSTFCLSACFRRHWSSVRHFNVWQLPAVALFGGHYLPLICHYYNEISHHMKQRPCLYLPLTDILVVSWYQLLTWSWQLFVFAGTINLQPECPFWTLGPDKAKDELNVDDEFQEGPPSIPNMGFKAIVGLSLVLSFLNLYVLRLYEHDRTPILTRCLLLELLCAAVSYKYVSKARYRWILAVVLILWLRSPPYSRVRTSFKYSTVKPLSPSLSWLSMR
ncbi:Aste57867_23709 [Aphanomyces stellatus]|uniref:Aste57867_23709 protein n=1 Tax=Aphanomyces stellatus TaxID=120398 RepID=A0A485LSX1_9STRA|nr:hypothetical protein As57867_023637 [Aphanomyces stellatus]VFU00354.1 Aste57867_23709 [Aphanomyces stellatus]